MKPLPTIANMALLFGERWYLEMMRDTPETFNQVADFVLDSNVDIMTCGILCPFINTPLYHRLNGDGRLQDKLPEDWKYYTSHHLTYILKNMSLQEPIDGFQYLYDKIYSTEVLRQRFQNAKEVHKIT